MNERNVSIANLPASSSPLVQWIVDQAEKAPAILGYLEQIVTAVEASDKWTALKALGDLIVADIENFSSLMAAPAPDARALHALGEHPIAKANGAIINQVLADWPQILAVIEAILALFGKSPAPSA